MKVSKASLIILSTMRLTIVALFLCRIRRIAQVPYITFRQTAFLMKQVFLEIFKLYVMLPIDSIFTFSWYRIMRPMFQLRRHA